MASTQELAMLSLSEKQQQQHPIREHVEDTESDPSTEFGSDDSVSENSDCESGDCRAEATFAVEDTIFIFDWDDTVLPTTWLEEQGLFPDDSTVTLNAEQETLLNAVAERASETLRVAKAHGTVVLVTNAEHGWVELSCQQFMPSLLPSLEGVKILSARSTFEWCAETRIERPSEWKYLAFYSEIGEFYELSAHGDRRKNVISIGDSPHERQALIRVMEHIPNSCVKAMKFTERPNIEQLLDEHKLLNECLGDIVHHKGSLDLGLQFA
jgi:hypothetical protein